MITQYDIPGKLTQLPAAFNFQPNLGNLNMNVYKELQQFTNYTRRVVNEHNYTQAKQCFKLASQLYTEGDNVVRNAIENIFIFSLSSFFPHDRVEKVILKSLIPDILYSLYVKQISRSG